MRHRPRSNEVVAGLTFLVLILTDAPAARAIHEFGDVPDNAFYHDAVGFLAETGITAGCGGGQFCPDSPVSRGQMAVLLKRVFDVMVARLAPLEVYDGNGAQIGKLIDVAFGSPGVPRVALAHNGWSFVVLVVRDRFDGNVEGPFFESPDCSGSPFVGDSSTPMPSVAVHAPGPGLTGFQVYLGDPVVAPQDLTMKSRLVKAAPRASGQCEPIDEIRQVRPALPLVDLDSLFIPPFTVRRP
jgi:hypothetical protein